MGKIMAMIMIVLLFFIVFRTYQHSYVEVDREVESQSDLEMFQNEELIEVNEKQIDQESIPVMKGVDLKELPVTQLIGERVEHVVNDFGQPERRDETPYGYTWWIYKFNNHYYQIGVDQQRVVTVYAIGPSVPIGDVTVGQTRQEIARMFSLKQQVTIEAKNGSYQWTLTDEDFAQRPLVKLDDQTVMQLYFDTFENELSSVRVLTNDVLLMHRPYDVSFLGQLPELPMMMKQDWASVENGMEKQIFEISNMVRVRFGEHELNWDDQIASVAFNHSKDMAEHNYFSHISLEGDGLQERLQKNEIYYYSAGENIAAQYPDAPSAVEGWLNSEGHREALLNESYSHLGVGVYRYYYTQNFLEKP